MTAPYPVPRAPEWVHRRLAGLPVSTPEATTTDEDLALEERIERFPEHSREAFDEMLGWCWK